MTNATSRPDEARSEKAPDGTPGGARAARRAALVLLALLAIVLIAAGCARKWPAEPPEAHEWQLTVAPLSLLPGQEAGRMLTAFAFAEQRPSPPSCDGVGDDDCEQYVGEYGRQTPARLNIACWDDDSDQQGEIDITFTPSRPVLDESRWHPREWQGWRLDFDGDTGPKNVTMTLDPTGDTPGLVDGFVAWLPKDEVSLALDHFREFAGNENAELLVEALFPSEDGSAPLEWRFDLSADSKADERIRHVVENCGRFW